MTPKRSLIVAALLAGLALAGCEDSTHDVLSKAEAVETKAELEAALGAPDIVAKVGPLETWTYKTSDGEVSFFITGDAVTIKAGSTSSKK